jgi:hypothetical protein
MSLTGKNSKVGDENPIFSPASTNFPPKTTVNGEPSDRASSVIAAATKDRIMDGIKPVSMAGMTAEGSGGSLQNLGKRGYVGRLVTAATGDKAIFCRTIPA